MNCEGRIIGLAAAVLFAALVTDVVVRILDQGPQVVVVSVPPAAMVDPDAETLGELPEEWRGAP